MKRNNIINIYLMSTFLAFLLLGLPSLSTAQANQPPVLNLIGARSVDEGANLNFGITATDVESIPVLTTSVLPTGAAFTDNADGTGTFDWTPDYSQSGSYDVTFYATDDSAAVVSEIVTITVTNVNRDPVLTAIGARSVNENSNLNFGISATDPDGNIPSFATSTLPTGAAFVDNGDGTGSFNWIPGYDQSGSYNVTFRATDGSLIDTEIVVITVTNVNRDPVLTAIGARSVNENSNLNFNISASDPDGTTPSFTISTLPTGATFVDNGNGTGTFNWTPGYDQSGSYNVTFRATDGSLIDTEIVVITVTNVNRDPVLSAIGAKSVNENDLLNFNILASDPDGTTPSFTTSTLPTGATFVDNGNGTGTFNWTPGYDQSGSYNVTFRATDGSLIDTEIVVITVTNVNRDPVLTAIGARSVNENSNLNFGISATDPDGNIPSFATSTLPTGAAFVDNGDGTGSFNWTPGYDQSGSYNVTFRATDGSLIDTEIVVITVTNVNRDPVLAAIGARSVNENSNLNFNISASDPDGTTPSFTTSTLPTGAAFVDNGDGTGSFNWIPGYDQSGSYNVTFRATDGSLIDTEIVVITVTNVNRDPVLAVIGAKSINENSNLNFNISASDPDGTTPSFTTSTLPTGATFVDNGNGTGTFNWTPSYTQSGSYNVTFRATDGSLIDTEIVAITVNQINLPPILAAIGSKSVTEGNNLNIGILGSDPDGTTPVLYVGTLPYGATFADNGNGTGTFNWTPTYNRAGLYNVAFYARDDSLALDSEIVTITVIEAGNQAPILAAIGNKSITEGSNLNFALSAADPDSTIPVLTTSALPTGAVFNDNGNGSGAFNWTPGFTQAGSYYVTFYASDGPIIDSERISINVFESGNQAPILAAVGNRGATEGINLNFNISAADPDGTSPVLSASSLPSGATFTNNGNGTGTFNWTPGYAQANSYNLTFYATDGVAIDSERIVITVTEAGNQTPVLAAIGNRTATEGISLVFNISASDPDATIPTLSSSTLPTGVSFVDHSNGTASFSWMPGYTQAGSYNVTFYASDGALIDSERITITVNDAGNQAPILSTIGSKSVREGNNLNFNISAIDPDGTTPAFSAVGLPTGAAFADNGNGTGTFNWTPNYTQAGSYQVVFRASDGSAIDSEIVSINVLEAGNQAPVIASIGPRSTTEGSALIFTVTATDPDGTTPSLSNTTLPSGASYVDNGNGTGSFNWTPTYLQSGSYNVSFYATDGILRDTELVTITVIDAGNQLPILAGIGARSTTENVNLSFSVSASDAEGVTPTLSTGTLPNGANFIDNHNGTGQFNWTPLYNQAGSYNVIFYAVDDSLARDSEIVAIMVNDGGNQTPILAAIGNRNTTEAINLTFAISAADPDSTIPTFSTSTLPSGATFINNGNGTGRFSWTPTYIQAGSYPVTFRASDGVAVDSETITITVADAGNQFPVLAAIGAKSTTENINLGFGVSASDPDGTIPSFTTSTLPTGATFIDNGNATGTFSWTPTYIQAGSYNITFYAGDGSLRDSEIVTITVIEAGNQPPVLSAVGAKSVNENSNLNFSINASDPDATTPILTTSALPSGASFVDNHNGTGAFNWTPGYTQAAGYVVTFYASDGAIVDSETIIITVVNVNAPPVLAAIGAKQVDEGANLSFAVSSSDIDGTIPTLTTSALPSGAVFTNNGNGTGSFSWTTGMSQAGYYDVTFYAADNLAAVDSEVVTITVGNINQLPILATIGAQSVNENANLNFSVNASDADGIFPILTTSTLPTGATFIDNGNGTGSFDWTPTYTQSGNYPVTFRASDGVAIDTEIVTITVNNVNRDPVLAAIGAQAVNENSLLSFSISASDPDGNIPSLTSSALPTGATFIDNGNGTASFNWTPTYTQSGSYPITFRASDGSLIDSEIVTITVNNINRDPILAAIGARSVNENSNLNFNISASDPDGNIPTLTSSTLPTGATFADNGNGTGTFNWTPGYDQSGPYNVTFRASDGSLLDTEIVTITVTNVNRDPILAAIGDRTVDENILLSFNILASDPDGIIPSFTASTLPTGATFTDNGDGTASFNWTPSYGQSGSYPITFRASDGVAIDSEIVTVTINNINLPPVLNNIGAQAINEAADLNFAITASDPDGNNPVLTTSALPTGATFTDNGNGSGVFDWIPSYTQSGSYPITFRASDGSLIDSEIVTITVSNTNRIPFANAGIDQSNMIVGATINLNGSGSYDPDGTTVTYSWIQVSGAAVTLSNAVIANPTFMAPLPGVYRFELIVYDGSDYSLPDTVAVSTINAAPPQAIADLGIAISSDNIVLSWPAVTVDTTGITTEVDGYIVYRDTMAYFTPSSLDSIGAVNASTLIFTDNNIGGVNVVGDTLNQYFYVVISYDIYGNRSAVSNRVGEFDYQIVTTLSTDYNLICIPFANTGITTADQLINAIGRSNVLTVNNYRPSSQSFESRFAAGFGVNFSVVPGGIYQVNAAAATIFSVAGRVPVSGAITYTLVTTASTDYCFLSIPFERGSSFLTAQDVMNNLPGSFNTLNNYIAGSQSYQSRFAAGFGVNFRVKAGKPYQANSALNNIFPGL
jgi:phage-related protein